MSLSMFLVIIENKLSRQLWSNNFLNSTFEKITATVTKVVLMEGIFFKSGLSDNSNLTIQLTLNFYMIPVNELNVFLTGHILCFKKSLAVSLKFFSFTAELRHLRFSVMHQFLSRLARIRLRWFQLIRKKFISFQAIYYLPTRNI